MARKPILVGGKREEIICAAQKLFLKNGYDGTSVRMVLDEVGGEVGMFYHYFSSKKELFEKVVEHFIKEQGEQLSILMSSELANTSMDTKLEQLIEYYYSSMAAFEKIANGEIHWTVLTAFHTMTVESMLPYFKALITHILTLEGNDEVVNIDCITAFVLKGISGLLRSKSFLVLSKEQQKAMIVELVCRVLRVSVNIFN